MQFAIKSNASGIIIGHNHSSGNVQPNESDISITRKVKESGIVIVINNNKSIITFKNFHNIYNAIRYNKSFSVHFSEPGKDG